MFNDKYLSSYIDLRNDNFNDYQYLFTITSDQEVYVMIHFYPSRMYPYGCTSATASKGKLSVIDASNGNPLQSGYSIYDSRVDKDFIHFDSLKSGTYLVKF